MCALVFFSGEADFFPQKLDKNYVFDFPQKYEEITIITKDEKRINGLLFKADHSKGVILYLHGNGGALNSWGKVAKTYTDLNYDICIIDYRGYGKSEGIIESQEQLFNDNQAAYNELKKRYAENKIIVLGYSLGSGLAAKLASENNPRLLILQAPYYSFTDMMRHTFPGIPTFILKYKLATNEYLKTCKMPVVIFHGKQDEVIYYGSSLKLQQEFKQQDVLIPLNMGHNGMTDNEVYKSYLKELLLK